MNILTTIGNLTRDPEMREVSGYSCCNFTVASNTRNKGADGKPTTNFYSCTAWGKSGETIARYMHKGDKIAFSGELVIRQYKDNNGVDRTAVGVNVSDFTFLSSRNAEGNARQAAPAQPSNAQANPSDEDTLPF